MTTTYNVNIVGSLTNNDGVLSGFSTSNYATTPSSFTFSSYNWEFNIKFTTGNNVSSDQNIVTPLMENNVDKDAVNIWINNSAISIYIYDNANDELIISGSLACSINTTYYIRCQYISGTYYIKYSSDGINYTDISTPVASALYIWETNQKWVFGLARGVNRPFLGSIDLNYCYLKINNTSVWRGVTKTSQVISHIQLRHDTAANWTSVNPILYEGEVGIETDTKKQKIGDGSTPWNNLAYDLGSTALQRLDADGQPVAKYLLVDNTKTAHSASADLSSYINDSTSASYEVLVEVNIASNNTTNLWVGNVADPYANKHGNAFCIGTNTTSGATQAHLACWLPLATSSRTLYYQLAGSSASSSADVNLLGYRRLGTNS